MSKAHRGKGIAELVSHGRGECPVCKRRNVKILYEQEAEGKKVKICKTCKAAIKHGKKAVASDPSYIRLAYRLPMAWCFSALAGLQSLIFFSTSAWLPSILQSRGYSLMEAAGLALFTQFLNIPATLAVPILCAWQPDQRRVVLVFSGMLFAGLLGFMFANSLALTMITLALFSFGVGSTLAFSNTFVSLRTDNALQSAALSGMGQTIGYVFGAIGPVLIGAIFDMTGSWTIPLLLLLTASLAYIFVGLSLGRDRSFFREYLDKKRLSGV